MRLGRRITESAPVPGRVRTTRSVVTTAATESGSIPRGAALAVGDGVGGGLLTMAVELGLAVGAGAVGKLALIQHTQRRQSLLPHRPQPPGSSVARRQSGRSPLR